MSSSPNLIRIQRVFREVLEDDSLAITTQDSPRTLPAWDSFAHVKLMIGLEDEFGVKLSMDEAEQLKDVASILNVIESKI